MLEFEGIEAAIEKLAGSRRPDAKQLREAVRNRSPSVFRLKQGGLVPNNPKLPLVVYRGAIKLSRSLDPAAMFEELFTQNGWGECWRNGIYDYVHYHPGIHEVVGIARGKAVVQFGGASGKKVKLNVGDVAILPAGTGHRCIQASNGLVVVGAYPPSGTYDEYTPTEENHARAIATISKVPLPKNDPVYGGDGPLLKPWSKK